MDRIWSGLSITVIQAPQQASYGPDVGQRASLPEPGFVLIQTSIGVPAALTASGSTVVTRALIGGGVRSGTALSAASPGRRASAARRWKAIASADCEAVTGGHGSASADPSNFHTDWPTDRL